MSMGTFMGNEGDKIKRAGEDAARGASQVKDDLNDAAGAAKHDIHEGMRKAGCHMHDAEHGVSDVMHKVCTETRDKPFKSLGIALGVGFITGVLFRRFS